MYYGKDPYGLENIRALRRLESEGYGKLMNDMSRLINGNIYRLYLSDNIGSPISEQVNSIGCYLEDRYYKFKVKFNTNDIKFKIKKAILYDETNKIQIHSKIHFQWNKTRKRKVLVTFIVTYEELKSQYQNAKERQVN